MDSNLKTKTALVELVAKYVGKSNQEAICRAMEAWAEARYQCGLSDGLHRAHLFSQREHKLDSWTAALIHFW